MHRHIAVRASLAAATLAMGATVASAQASRSAHFVEDCNRSTGNREQFCETRTVSLAASNALRIDGRPNGGVTVHAWDNNTFQVVAMVQAQATTAADAQAIARQINVTASNGEISANGPDRSDNDNNTSWSVSYEVWAPRHTDLALTSTNGGISIDGMDSKMDLQTTNGGLSLTDVHGDVRGSTQNGGVTAELTGDSWRGAGLDLRTMNGGVRLIMPTAYSAHLETGTVNGRLDLGIPVTVSGRLDRNITADLGRGGATIHASTTNGGVSIQRR
jgi:hypothetical protein